MAKQDKIAMFYSLLTDLRSQYPTYDVTWSFCPKCKINSSRGGHCAECIELDIAEITTPSLAHDLYCAIKAQAEAIHNIKDHLDE